jgi:pyruvate kinase
MGALDMSRSRVEAQELLGEVRALSARVEEQGSKICTAWRPKIERRPFVLAAYNFARYIALRRTDLRGLQTRLMPLGLSSLGRCEGRVRPNLDAVISALSAVCGEAPVRAPRAHTFFRGNRLLAAETERVFGPRKGPPAVRIMVTMPPEAATDGGKLIHDLVAAGMDSARINCAHDSPEAWRAMAASVVEAREKLGLHCSVYADLAGPKIRTLDVHVRRDGRVYPGDRLVLVRSLDDAKASEKAFTCTIPAVFERLAAGDRVWIDDGHIGCTVERLASPERIELRVNQARERGDKLRAGKGLNFPGTRVPVSPLGEADKEALAAVIDVVDIIGYSFVREPSDVELLQQELARLGRPRLPIALKIETAEADKHLPELIVQAAGRQPAAVMIARGDLAVEIGYRRLAEMQEELLWLCEAASIPVIWATQVLDNLVKTGIPTRAEVTDAAMAERAECVMLNKGPSVVRAVEILSDVLPRMAAHQTKKTARMRALSSW